MKCTLKYLEACNKVFENGLLSHERVTNLESEVLKSIMEGYNFFVNGINRFYNQAQLQMQQFLS